MGWAKLDWAPCGSSRMVTVDTCYEFFKKAKLCMGFHFSLQYDKLVFCFHVHELFGLTIV